MSRGESNFAAVRLTFPDLVLLAGIVIVFPWAVLAVPSAMVRRAQPADFQWKQVVIVMAMRFDVSADLAGLTD